MAGATPAPIAEVEAPISPEQFEALRAESRPVIIRGLVKSWPAVAAAQQCDRAIVDYLTKGAVARPVGAIAASPAEQGRFFYTPDLSRLNFVKGSGRLETFLEDLLSAAGMSDAPAMAVQSEDIASLMPRFVAENRFDLLPEVAPRIWIGNRIRVAPHYDAKENVACCVAGRRRFTVFPLIKSAIFILAPLN